jgi:drug/metabolite transporter (DMT)-like permease
MKVGIGELSPLAFPVFRFGLGAIVMAFLVRRREGTLRFERRDLRAVLAIAVFGITLNQLCSMFALTLTTAANVALLTATQPIFTAVIATLVGDETLGRRHWLAIALGMGGVALVVDGSAHLATAAGPSSPLGPLPLGEILALGVSLTAAASSVVIRRLLRRYTPYRILALQMIIGTALLAPVAAPSLAAQDYAAVGAVGWGALAYSSILAGVVTNLLYFTGIGRVGASRAAIYQYLQSFAGVVLAVALLREPLGPLQILGGLTVVASVLLSRGNLLSLPGRSRSTAVAASARATDTTRQSP